MFGPPKKVGFGPTTIGRAGSGATTYGGSDKSTVIMLPPRNSATSMPSAVLNQLQRGYMEINAALMSREDLLEVAEQLKAGASTIKTLRVVCCPKGLSFLQYYYSHSQDHRAVHQHIFNTQQHKDGVQTASANVQHHKVRRAFYEAVCSVLSKAPITELVLGMRFSETGYKMLSQALPKCTTLKRLSFAGSHMGDERAMWLKPGLLGNTSLEELDFTACDLTDYTASSIAAVIKHHADRRLAAAFDEQLREYPDVSLPRSQAQVTYHARLRAIARSVDERYGGLLHLELAENKLTDRSVWALRAALAYDRRLIFLSMRANKLSSEAEAEFVGLMKEHQALLRVDLRQNADAHMGILKLNRKHPPPKVFSATMGYQPHPKAPPPSSPAVTVNSTPFWQLRDEATTSLGPTPMISPRPGVPPSPSRVSLVSWGDANLLARGSPRRAAQKLVRYPLPDGGGDVPQLYLPHAAAGRAAGRAAQEHAEGMHRRRHGHDGELPGRRGGPTAAARTRNRQGAAGAVVPHVNDLDDLQYDQLPHVPEGHEETTEEDESAGYETVDADGSPEPAAVAAVRDGGVRGDAEREEEEGRRSGDGGDDGETQSEHSGTGGSSEHRNHHDHDDDDDDRDEDGTQPRGMPAGENGLILERLPTLAEGLLGTDADLAGADDRFQQRGAGAADHAPPLRPGRTAAGSRPTSFDGGSGGAGPVGERRRGGASDDGGGGGGSGGGMPPPPPRPLLESVLTRGLSGVPTQLRPELVHGALADMTDEQRQQVFISLLQRHARAPASGPAARFFTAGGSPGHKVSRSRRTPQASPVKPLRGSGARRKRLKALRRQAAGAPAEPDQPDYLNPSALAALEHVLHTLAAEVDRREAEADAAALFEERLADVERARQVELEAAAERRRQQAVAEAQRRALEAQVARYAGARAYAGAARGAGVNVNQIVSQLDRWCGLCDDALLLITPR